MFFVAFFWYASNALLGNNMQNKMGLTMEFLLLNLIYFSEVSS